MNRRGFLQLFGKAAAVPAIAAIPVIAKSSPDELDTSYRYVMKRVVDEGNQVRSSGFYEEGVQPLSVILEHLKDRSEGRYQWVLTVLEPV